MDPQPKQDNTLLIVVIVAIVWAVSTGGNLKLNVPAPPAPAPAPAVVAPSTDAQAAVAPIKVIAAAKPDAAKRLAGLYRVMADVVGRDTGRIKTNAQLREYLISADSFKIAGTDLAGSLPGFGAAKDAALAKLLGLEDATLDRSKAVDALSAIAWALGG